MTTTCPAFERTSKRRRGFPSETRVKRGLRFVRGGPDDPAGIELIEKLGRNDPCPCGSGRSFQEVLPQRRPLSTAPSGRTIGGSEACYGQSVAGLLRALSVRGFGI